MEHQDTVSPLGLLGKGTVVPGGALGTEPGSFQMLSETEL